MFEKRSVLRSVVACWAVLLLSIPARTIGAERFEFTRLLAHWSDYGDADYLKFVDEAKPEVVQVGFYGAHLWGLVDTPYGSGYPAHLPVRGQAECAAWFKSLNAELHKRGAKVIGHMNVKFLVGDPESAEGPRGFFKFYQSGWNESVLGPKPVADPLDFLEKSRNGKPLVDHSYNIGGMNEYWACLNNPHWRAVLKAWVRHGIAQGVDGFIANYFYRHDCHCSYCIKEFRDYLRENFGSDRLENEFSISDLEAHDFEEILSWHDPAQSTPLRREMLRFSQIANKKAFDEVFAKYGRSIKPDLIVAQWNHLGDFDQISGDERCMLPAGLWGRNEDYLWYSTGDSANSTALREGKLGEATLQARYIRGAFDDKPFTLGKYESVRIRVAIAELAANGGAPMGFYANFKDPKARQEIVRYYSFLRKNEPIYHASRSQAEMLLLFPRKSVHAGNIEAVKRFKQIGRHLLDEHVLFDILPDDLLTDLTRRRYAKVLEVGKKPTEAATSLPDDRSRFDAPRTVRVSASRSAERNEVVLHFVNYNRNEPENGRGSGIIDERPTAAPAFDANLKLSPEARVSRVEFLTPENEQSTLLQFEQNGTRLHLRVPEFLVYGVVRIQLN